MVSEIIAWILGEETEEQKQMQDILKSGDIESLTRTGVKISLNDDSKRSCYDDIIFGICLWGDWRV
ncbi:hypothetical protein IHP33_04045 [Enterococcus faecalis]|uniref:hypothetical protein n=1 Tax=Enterococcus faecalis TaxID=1351 RepID=UPI00177CF9FD|nr:hypothetical protein [Enterococcus faecalis]MBD9844890.1 hypothetical protein [Enterococcus faecalis]